MSPVRYLCIKDCQFHLVYPFTGLTVNLHATDCWAAEWSEVRVDRTIPFYKQQSKTLCAQISKQVSAFASFKSHLAVFPNTVVRNWNKINMCFQDSLFTWHPKRNVTKMISLLRSASQRRKLRYMLRNNAKKWNENCLHCINESWNFPKGISWKIWFTY